MNIENCKDKKYFRTYKIKIRKYRIKFRPDEIKKR